VNRALGIAAAGLGATAVALGAFGAHALRGQIDDSALQVWHTAVEYQFWHALAVLAIAGFAAPAERVWHRAGCTLVAGTILFCASLYPLALGAPRWFGMLTPFGGVVLIIGWAMTGYGFWCSAAKR
jgi:uncharacterized membrane protein YgdD (TMEM256/DUF423 family)